MIEGFYTREREISDAVAGALMPIERVTDREELRRFLMKDRLANAYLLGNLDPQYSSSVGGSVCAISAVNSIASVYYI